MDAVTYRMLIISFNLIFLTSHRTSSGGTDWGQEILGVCPTHPQCHLCPWKNHLSALLNMLQNVCMDGLN